MNGEGRRWSLRCSESSPMLCLVSRARAIETQCWVVAAAQAGVHNEKRESHGHAMVSGYAR